MIAWHAQFWNKTKISMQYMQSQSMQQYMQ